MPSISRMHNYALHLEWLGNRGSGTSGYRDYDRACELRGENLPPIPGSSDRVFRGDPTRWNPEQLLVAAASQCHMLSYLHLAAVNGVVVVAYTDDPSGVMTETGDGGGRFTEIMLRPTVTVADASQVATAESLHAPASRKCFIAASLALPVQHQPATRVAAPGAGSQS
jgi:organic hydroperoxide reductase OsmC/OhrA